MASTHHSMQIFRTLLVLVPLASPVVAQSRVAELPAGLVTALLATDRYGAPAGGASRFYVAELPPDWPAQLTPRAPAVVVGGMVSGNTTTMIFADTSRRFLASYLEQIQRAGFVQPTSPPEAGFGFNAQSYNFLCRDSLQVQARQVPGAMVGANISVQAVKTQFPFCVFPSHSIFSSAGPSKRVLTLPPLIAPSDVTVARGGAGSSGESQINTTVELRGSMLAPAAVLRHYVSQLNAIGWTAEFPASSDHAAAALLSAKDSSGRAWHGTLSVGAYDKNALVSLTMLAGAQ